MGNYGIKDIYQGALLAGSPITINGVDYKENDVILFFDSIQEIVFQEDRAYWEARGGHKNPQLVTWDDTPQVNCSLNMGVISQAGYGLVNKAILKSYIAPKAIRQFETCPIEEGKAVLKHVPNNEYPIRVFSRDGVTIEEEILDFYTWENTIIVEGNHKEIFVDYYFSDEMNIKSVPIGDKMLNGDFKFVGKFYYSNEQQGSRKTAIIEIPKLKLASNFNLRLGRNTNPFITVMSFSALPSGEKNKVSPISIWYLDADIDGDF